MAGETVQLLGSEMIEVDGRKFIVNRENGKIKNIKERRIMFAGCHWECVADKTVYHWSQKLPERKSSLVQRILEKEARG